MVRLIDADALRREVQQIAFHGNGGILTVMAINKAPTVEAIPVEWVETYMQRFTPITQWAFKGMIRVWREKNG